MGNFSRDTFDKSKRYTGVRLQQGVPLVDADWNELDDIRKWEVQSSLRWYIGDGIPTGSDGFAIKQVGENGAANDFKISYGGDGTPEGDGRCLVAGREALIEEDLRYTEQPLFENDELANKWGVEPLPALDTPPVNMEYLVYLDIWEREVNSSEDPDLQDPRIGMDTCVRLKREWVVRVVKENEIPDPPEGHVYYQLARIIRRGNRPKIQDKDIIDLRSVGLTLQHVRGTTGIVVFPPFPESKQHIFGPIDPCLGPGSITVRLGLEMGNGNIFMGDSSAAELLVGNQIPKMGVMINPDTGTFTIGIDGHEVPNKSTKIRWWANKIGIEKETLNVPEGITVRVTPEAARINIGCTQQFMAAVSGTTDIQTEWLVNDVPGGNTTFGTITDNGIYTAPDAVPSPASFKIRAKSVADPTRWGEADVKILDVTLVIRPTEVILKEGSSQQFVAYINGDPANNEVDWYVNDLLGGNIILGTVSQGLYKAPNIAFPQLSVKIRAVSKKYSSKKAAADVKVVKIEPCTAGQPDKPCTMGGPNKPCLLGLPDKPCPAGNPVQCPAGNPDTPCTAGKPQQCTAGKPNTPCTAGKPGQPCSAGGPDKPCPMGEPDWPCEAGKPNEPCLLGRPDKPCPMGGPNNPCPAGNPKQPIQRSSDNLKPKAKKVKK